MAEDVVPRTQFDLEGFGGELLRPSDEAYDEARQVFNGMIDRRPALIARCASAGDVVAAVNLARDIWDPGNLFRHNQNIPPTAS